MFNEGIDLEKIQDLVEVIQDNSGKVSNYEIEIIIDILKNENFRSNIYYDYLTYFCHKVDTLKLQNIVAENLSYFHCQSEISISELNDAERDLMLLPYMSDYNLTPRYNIKKVYEFLVQDSDLKKLILFLFSNNLNIPLTLKSYELIHQNSRIIYEYICKITPSLDNESMYQMLLQWTKNGCTVYDLKVLENKLQSLDKNITEKIFCNRSSYINFIFGNKLCNFPLEYIRRRKRKIAYLCN